LGPGFIWDAGARKWSLGFNITLPILNKNEGPIAEAEAKRKLTAVTVEALQARIIGDIDQTLASYRSALTKLATSETLIGSQKKRQDALARQFRAGEADKLQLTSTRLELVAIELLRENARVSAVQALGALEDALGRPLDEAMALPTIPEKNPRDEVSRK
jgi:outer membrane protein, heavy metal efflux system